MNKKQEIIKDDTAFQLTLFKKLIDIIKGRDIDPRDHVTVITNPTMEHLISSSNITPKQAQSITNCYIAAELYPEYVPLKTFAETVLKSSISTKDGWGINKGIELASAYAPNIITAAGTSTAQQPEQQQKKKGFFRRNKGEQTS